MASLEKKKNEIYKKESDKFINLIFYEAFPPSIDDLSLPQDILKLCLSFLTETIIKYDENISPGGKPLLKITSKHNYFNTKLYGGVVKIHNGDILHTNWVLGYMDGVQKKIYSNGNIKCEHMYILGKKNGIQKAWYENLFFKSLGAKIVQPCFRG